ncbi:hypothetical protein OAH83_01830 [Methylophilaceae bacterium]|nr:hypothetical protein [Methylophilaceae bacterium]
MKKIVLALTTTLLLPNMSYAAACADGANAAGCTIGTTGIDYTLTGDIAPASGVIGIEFTSGATTNTTTLTGDISTTGGYGHGLSLSDSDSNTTSLTGNISTTGDFARGLSLSSSDSNTTTLTGNITTTQKYGWGLYLEYSVGNTTTLKGNITTEGNAAHGLYLAVSNFNTTNFTGNITTTGDWARWLSLENSDSNTVNFTGSLSATGASSYGIHADSASDNNTIVFNQGSQIIGGLYNDGANNTLTFNLGRAASYNFTTSGAVNWVLDDTTKTVIAGSAKSRGVADMDDAGNRLYQRLSQINSSLTNQQRQTRQGYARGDYWIDSYYTDSERDTSPAQINQHTRGITVGFNASGDRDLAMDVIINYENSDAGYGLSEQTVDSNSLMVGLSFPELMTAMDGSLAVKFLAGMSDNDRDLTVLNNTVSTGQETITDSYDSTYVTAGASWMQSLYATQRFTSQFLLGMDINHEQIEGSTASAYYRLDDRDITQLVGQAQYGVTYTGINEKLTINGNIGVSHANIIDGEKQHYTIDGTAVSYTADNSNTYTTASLGATYQLNPQAYAYANVKQFDSTDDIDGTTGNVGLVVNF